jgi:hypothetical protein
MAAPPALAGTVEIHSGAYGVHAAIDNTEYAGAKCQYSLQQLDAITIRQPILFARDRTGGTDTQRVGWAFTIQYATDIGGTTWADYTNSPIVAHSATDKVNAHFKPRTWHLTNAVKTPFWRVINQFFWYYPDANHESGRTFHVVYHYQVEDQVASGNGCPDLQPKTVTTPPPPGHSGIYGVHLLIDNGEYAGVTCRYGATSFKLHTITVRQPIAFAFDRTASTDAQGLGWSYTVQWRDAGTWHELSTSSILKVTATDAANAEWHPRTFTFSGLPTHSYYRVVVHLNWYHAGHADGAARHLVSLYHLTGSGFSFTDLACARSPLS